MVQNAGETALGPEFGVDVHVEHQSVEREVERCRVNECVSRSEFGAGVERNARPEKTKTPIKTHVVCRECDTV